MLTSCAPTPVPATEAETITVIFPKHLYAFIFTNVDAKTIPVLIGEFSTKLGLEYLGIAAAGVLASLPPILLALVFQRFIVRGLTSGATK